MSASLLIVATTIVAVFSVSTTPTQDDPDPLKKGWPKLVEAWKRLDAYEPSKNPVLSDEYLKLMNELHDSFQAAGLMETDLPFDSGALKRLIRIRGAAATTSSEYRTYTPRVPSSPGMTSFLKSIHRLQALKKKGLDDADNVADEQATIRKALKGMYLTADETPLWLRRRLVNLSTALVLGRDYPALAKATDDQKDRIAQLIEKLSGGDIEERDQAQQDLGTLGEPALPQLHRALKDADTETKKRVQAILGVGHQPWKNEKTGLNHPQFRDDAAQLELEALRNMELQKAMEREARKKLKDK